MKFCQADGTLLVDETSGVGGDDDPFKTVLAEPKNTSVSEEPEFDPMKTMLATPPPVNLPPPTPFGDAFSVEPKDTGVNAPPSFGDLGAPQFGSNPPLPSESFPQPQAVDNFGQQPSGGFGSSAPNAPTFQEPEPPFGQQANFGQQPFEQQPNEWTPPPVPQQNWGNQGLGQNTPFNPPPANANANGTPKILGIISLVMGIISFPAMCLCYLNFLTAPIGIVTGGIAYFMSRNDSQAGSTKWFGLGGAVASLISLILVIVLIIASVGISTLNR